MTLEIAIALIEARKAQWQQAHDRALQENIMSANNYKMMIKEYDAILAALR